MNNTHRNPIESSMLKKITFAVLTFALLSSNLFAASLSEVRISWPGDDDDVNNFVEIAGTPGESLDALTLVSLSTEFEPGEVSFAFPLTGQTIPADGFFLASGDDAFYGGATDLVTEVDFFGSPQIFALLENFTGAQGDDYDTDNDGTLDAAPWDGIVDAVGLLDGDDNTDHMYDPTLPTVGPDGNFPPAHAYRVTADGPWEIGLFGDAVNDTPGAMNVPEPASALMALIFGMGALAWRRRR